MFSALILACSSLLIFGSVRISFKIDVHQANFCTCGNIGFIVTYCTLVRFVIKPKLMALSDKEHMSSNRFFVVSTLSFIIGSYIWYCEPCRMNKLNGGLPRG